MTDPIGRTRWATAEGYIPSESHGPAPAMTSHETACMLNAATATPACASLSSSATATRPAPTGFPRDVDYASLIESDVPIVVQHSRLDSRQSELALLSMVAFADGA